MAGITAFAVSAYAMPSVMVVNAYTQGKISGFINVMVNDYTYSKMWLRPQTSVDYEMRANEDIPEEI